MLVRQDRVGGQYTQVTFKDTFDQAPYVFVVPTERGRQPSSIRIRYVTSTGFELDIVEPAGENGRHLPQQVHYVAVTPGVHYTPQGIKLTAQSINTTSTVFGKGVDGVRSWEDVLFE